MVDHSPPVERTGPELLTRAEVARRLNVNPQTIYRWTRDGLLMPIALPSGQHRYRLADIDAIVAGEHRGKRFRKGEDNRVRLVS